LLATSGDAARFITPQGEKSVEPSHKRYESHFVPLVFASDALNALLMGGDRIIPDERKARPIERKRKVS
jgi:hypothetical protein